MKKHVEHHEFWSDKNIFKSISFYLVTLTSFCLLIHHLLNKFHLLICQNVFSLKIMFWNSRWKLKKYYLSKYINNFLRIVCRNRLHRKINIYVKHFFGYEQLIIFYPNFLLNLWNQENWSLFDWVLSNCHAESFVIYYLQS